MPEGFFPIDDRRLLELLELVRSVPEAAVFLGYTTDVVVDRARKYVAAGIVRGNHEGVTVDWQAFEQWADGSISG